MAPLHTFDLALLPVAPILWGVLACAFIVFCIYSAIMLWHWKEYSNGKFTTTVHMFVYLGVGGAFLAVMGLAATWYTL